MPNPDELARQEELDVDELAEQIKELKKENAWLKDRLAKAKQYIHPSHSHVFEKEEK